MSTISIYCLIDPVSFKVRYIGKAKHPQKRLKDHISAARRGSKVHCKTWIRQLLEMELEPLLEVIEHCTEENWQERERHWIAYYKAGGARLCNHTDGGEGLVNPSEATKEKQRANNRRNKHIYQTPEFREKVGVASRAMVRTPEHCARISAAKKGKPRSEETRRRMSEALRGRVQSEEEKAMRAASLAGKSRKAKEVQQLDGQGNVVTTYPSMTSCAKAIGVLSSVLFKGIKANRKVNNVLYRYAP